MNNLEILIGSAARLKSLETPNAEQKIVVIRTPFMKDGKPILLGKRSEGHLIALFSNEVSQVEVPGNFQKLSNGFQLSLENLQDPVTKDNLSFVELSNVGSIDVTLFGAFLDELLGSLDKEGADLIAEIHSLLGKWKNMLALDIDKTMSFNAVIGLFGELFLLDHLVNNLNSTALDNWVGPAGNRHDFEFEFKSIEVKSTTVKNGNEIHVSGVTQLEAYPGKSVDILRVKLEIEPNGISLPSIIEKLAASQNIDRLKFFDKLSKVGYLPGQADRYKDICFQPIEFQIIPVNSDFPRITAQSLLSIDPSSRIKEIQYVVNVSGLEEQRHPTLNSIDFKGLK